MDALEAWEKLGGEGRRFLAERLRELFAVTTQEPRRVKSAVMTIDDISAMKCASHPIERVASAWGCGCLYCQGQATVLSSRGGMQWSMASGQHAAALVKAFVTEPQLLVPDDIPQYALRCLSWGKKFAANVHREDKRRVAFAQKQLEKTARAAARKKAAETRKQLKKAREASYAYRIEQAVKKAQKVLVEINQTKKRLAQLERKKAASWRSVAALKRAAEKKGEVVP